MQTSPTNLHQLARELGQGHQNVVAGLFNDHCLRLAVNEDATYEWHAHPDSDELFIVLEGELLLELRDQPPLQLGPGDFHKVPAGQIHRTTARGRTVNLCLESTRAKTVFT